MSLVFKTIQTEGIAELSYLLGDDDAGVAAVFDPRPDVDVYVDMARETKVAVTHIFETHIHPETPWGILTGDSLFVSSAGRPDLLGADHTKDLAEKQFHTLRDFYLKLPDHVMIYPNHGAGSPCGADIGDRLSSTIGYERKFNKFLQFDDITSFTNYALTSAPPVPKYYPVMKKVN